MKFRNEKGLTLIELLITIAVIAVVAAISVPVVSNVIAASNTNSLAAMQEQVDQFVAEAAESGSVTLNGSTLEARIDQNGDGVDEYLVKTFPVDSKYTVSGTGDGPYTISANGVSGGNQTAGSVTLAATDFDLNLAAYPWTNRVVTHSPMTAGVSSESVPINGPIASGTTYASWSEVSQNFTTTYVANSYGKLYIYGLTQAKATEIYNAIVNGSATTISIDGTIYTLAPFHNIASQYNSSTGTNTYTYTYDAASPVSASYYGGYDIVVGTTTAPASWTPYYVETLPSIIIE